MLARNCTRNRQILIDKSPDTTANPPNNLDEGKLVEKANELVTKMSSKSSHPTTDIRVVGAKKLQNGGIVYELNNPESAQWMWKEKAEFMKHYSKSSIIKDKSVSIIVEYVPIAHSPDALGESRKIEHEMGIPSESVDQQDGSTLQQGDPWDNVPPTS